VPFRNIHDPAKLRRLLESVLLLEADLSLPVLLHHIIEEASTMAGARYGALGVLNDDRSALAEFITVGIEPNAEVAIGPRPTGKGVLGLLIEEPLPIRVANISEHPKTYGFPPNHPPMKSFLGLPIKAHDEVFGNLYLTDKIGSDEFTKDDEELVQALALAAGIAIDNARLHARVREVAVFDDRDRIARDLHDSVIQRLFAVGLSLQGITRSIPSDPFSERLNRAISDIDDTIRQIRSSIFELTSTADTQGNRTSVLSLVDELREIIGFEVPVAFEGPVDTALPSELLDQLLFALRETLTNIGRHAQATEAHVTVRVSGSSCVLRVSDNGRGMGSGDTHGGGLGLVNLRRRAEKLRGDLKIESSERGTTIEWAVSLVPA
jgi:signal transduction histidine kinase